MRVVIKGVELPPDAVRVIEENGRAVGYGLLAEVLEACRIPVQGSIPAGAWVPLRRLAEAFKLSHQYLPHPDHAFYIDCKPLPPLPDKPVGHDVPPWRPVTAPICGGPGDRRPDLLERIIAQFRVKTNPRYRQNQQGKGETYCNIFVWDVTRALGAEIPHWVTGPGEPSGPGAGRELDANATVDWLRRRGPDHGWRPAKVDGAVAAAGSGLPAVAAWQNPKGIGHVAILFPGSAHPDKGPAIAQAGAVNADDIYVADGFGRAAAAQIEYFVHS